MAKLKLSQVPTGSVFIDSESKYGQHDIAWQVVAHDWDGEGVTTLILADEAWNRETSVNYTYFSFAYDAKEPTSPDSNIRDHGNADYATSNLLQFLNSDGLANQWFTPQHEYDQAPISPYVTGVEYGKRDAFLAHFTDELKNVMIPVTKMGVTRKVHITAANELATIIRDKGSGNLNYDSGRKYDTHTWENTNQRYLLVRGNNEYLLPLAFKTSNSGTVEIWTNHVNNTYNYYPCNEYSTAPSGYTNDTTTFIPMIFLDSDTPVEYDTESGKYYTAWDIAPTITYQRVGGWKTSAFDIAFRVDDADEETVSVIVKIDNTQIYSNPSVVSGSYITVSVDATMFGNLAYGKHTISIIADDTYKTTTKTDYFRKVDTAPSILSSISENRVFVDNNTTHNNTPIEWLVAAREIDGEGIVSLMMKNPISNMCYDAKEVYNPNSTYSSYGNPSYVLSNLLQWLNDDGAANAWYSNQHEYDYPPNSTDVGGTYAKTDGFLHNFGRTLLDSLKEITKMGVSRKVHIPSYTELLGNTEAKVYSDAYNKNKYDSETKYLQFNGMSSHYKSLVTAQYPTTTPSIHIRSGVVGNNMPGRLSYATYNSSYSSRWSSNSYCLSGASPNATGSYTIPVIYLNGDEIPVRYDAETDKYYLDYSVETQYADYGKHKAGFTIGIKVNCSTNIGDTTVRAYIDGSTTEAATMTISTFNEFTNINLSDSAVQSLALGNHTILLVTDTYGITGSATITYTKVEESYPVILAENIGNVTQPISTTYQVYDEDGDSLDVTIKLDNETIDTQSDVQQHTDILLSVSTSTFNSLTYGNHSITIEATDGTNTSTTNLPFVKNSEPEIALNLHDLGEVIEPVSIIATYSSADGDEITIVADIDGQEIPV